MKIKRWWLVTSSLIILILVIVAMMLLTKPQPPCRPRSDDPQGYLFKICTYIQANKIDVSPASPTSYSIKHIEERTEGDREVIWVYLSCCYLGDMAIIDKVSGEMIDFRLGAK
jgi:hypothetical protein